MEEHKKNTVVISAFPASGKSYAAKHYQNYFSILDAESSEFHWIKQPVFESSKYAFGPKITSTEKSPDFPQNYINYIKENIGKYDVIFTSSHLEVRKALTENSIDFVTAYPHYSTEYKERWAGRMWLRAMDDERVLKSVMNNWDNFMQEIYYGEDNRYAGLDVYTIENYLDLKTIEKIISHYLYLKSGYRSYEVPR